MDTFEGTNGGERPARATLALVLDASYGTSGLPVDVTVDDALIVVLISARQVHFGFVSKHLLVLIFAVVRESVVANGEVALRSVDLVDLALSLNEIFKTSHELLNRVVLFAPLSDVMHVLKLHVRDLGGDGASEECQSKGFHSFCEGFVFKLLYAEANQSLLKQVQALKKISNL